MTIASAKACGQKKIRKNWKETGLNQLPHICKTVLIKVIKIRKIAIHVKIVIIKVNLVNEERIFLSAFIWTFFLC